VASPLENLSGPGRPLQKEPPDAKEFVGLKRSALARLTDSAKNSNSLESRFDLGLSLNDMGAQSALAGSLIGQRNKALCQLGHQIALFLHTYFLIFNSIFNTTEVQQSVQWCPRG
jgi:hypothetical protein